jgi:DNA-binding GntR family transcriptional regulator
MINNDIIIFFKYFINILDVPMIAKYDGGEIKFYDQVKNFMSENMKLLCGGLKGEADAETDSGYLDSDEKVFRYIFERICNGLSLPGVHINEHKISKELKLSIILVRQAVERLMHTGLIERIPNKGVFLKKLSLKDLDDIYQARRLIEIDMIRHLARHITDEQLSQLRCEIEFLNERSESLLLDGFHAGRQISPAQLYNDPPFFNTGDLDNEKMYFLLIMADIRFHMQIIRFAGNRLFEKLAESFIPKAVLGYRLYHSQFYDPELWRLFIGNLQKNNVSLKIVTHERLYQALAARDADLAAHLMRDHLDDSYHLKKAKIELLEHIRFMNSYSQISGLIAQEA